MNPFAQDPSEEIIGKNLLRNAVNGNWSEVIAIYKQDQKAHRAKITRSGDTALHIAIADGQESIVEELVSIVAGATPGALEIQNKLGDTPLHLAAYQRKVRMCRCIAKQDSKLMGIRNKDNETPFFIAVRHGRNEAFLCLHSLCEEDEGYAYCRGRDGETILHSAISGEYFDMAFQIMHLYDKLVNSVTQQGFSPLHVLASKPSAFRSGSHIRGLDKLVYNYKHVDKLRDWENSGKSVSLPHPPRNITRAAAVQIDQEIDLENQNGQQFVYEIDMVLKIRSTCFHALRLIFAKTIEAMALVVSERPTEIQNLRKEKEKHTWSFQIMEKLLMNSRKDLSKYGEIDMTESVFLLAARNGILEMVEKILVHFPTAIHGENIDRKNIVLLAAENKHPLVYQFLLNQEMFKRNIFEKTDKDGNNALHLAGMKTDHQPLGLPGPAFKMQWKMKWYEFVKNSMPLNFFERRNMKGQTPSELFIANHKDLVEEAGKWLKDTSKSCSVVATLIATVAFATSTSIPGGLKQEGGVPALGKEPAFCVFGLASLVALAFSISSIMLFLSFFSSSYQERTFIFVLPAKLLLAMMCLFISLVSMLVSFCAAHFLIIKDQLKYFAFPLYAVIFLLVTCYSFVHCPWFLHAALNAFNHVPERSAKQQLT